MADKVTDSLVSRIFELEDNRFVLNSRLSNSDGADNTAYSIHKADSFF
jgi:hypothetical protein